MRKSRFPGCCGVNIISSLGKGKLLPGKAEEDFKKKIEEAIESSAQPKPGGWRGLLMAITSVQNDRREALLLKRGFKILRKQHNPNSKNELHILGLDLTREYGSRDRKSGEV